MSLLPILMDLVDDPLEDSWRYNRMPYQFGLGMVPDHHHYHYPASRRNHSNLLSWPSVYSRPWQMVGRRRSDDTNKSKSAMAHSTTGKDGFQVSLDVEHFAPNEITVKTVDNTIIVEGKHEEKQDEHGQIYRHFVRRYDLPTEYHVKDVISTLSSDGILTIKAPPAAKAIDSNERVVHIQQTGPAHLSVKANPKEDQNNGTGEKMTE